MWCITNLEMDMFGSRIQDMLGYRLVPLSLEDYCCSNAMEIARAIVHTIPSGLSNVVSNLGKLYSIIDEKEVLGMVNNHLQLLQAAQKGGSEFERETASLIMPYVYGTLASIKASLCIASGEPIAQDIHYLYKLSEDADLMSRKLKYASMLYCSGQFEEAAAILSHCKGLLCPDISHYCSCLGRECYRQTDNHLQKRLNTSTEKQVKRNYTTCVKFSKREASCVPKHLRCEMNRTQTPLDKKLRNLDNHWMDLVVIDCVPFLYYLQYLIYRKLDDETGRFIAAANLESYVYQPEGILGHSDTAIHVFAHIFELENQLHVAWSVYTESIKLFITNNAARFHLQRLRG